MSILCPTHLYILITMFGKKDHFKLANAFYESGEFEEAIDHLKQALSDSPENTTILERQGDCYTGLRDYDSAITYYLKTLEKNNQLPAVYNSLGLVYLHCDNFEKAIKSFEAAIEINHEQVVYYKNLQLAIKRRKDFFALKNKQKENPNLYIRRAEDFLRHYNFRHALFNYRKAFNLDRTNHELAEKVRTLEIRLSQVDSSNADDPSDDRNRTGDIPREMGNSHFSLYLQELNSLVGLSEIKKDTEQLINFLKLDEVRASQGLKRQNLTLHSIFIGSPGTGKTTVARLLGKIFKAMGILASGHVVEVDRSGLVAEYVGQTAVKTNRVIDSAIDGVLFIDEAYTLSKSEGPGDYGREAIEILLKRMEDDKDRLIVIAAGYPEPMKEFLESNPGLKSRFSRHFKFEDYTPQELSAIFKLKCSENEYVFEEQGLRHLEEYLKTEYETRDQYFGNARLIRNLFEELVKIQSNRLAAEPSPTKNELQTLYYDDFKEMLKDKLTVKRENMEDLMGELGSLVGLESVKEEVNSLLNYLDVQIRRSQKGFAMQQISLHSVFYGPPGTGKTTMARLFGRILKQMGILKKGHVVEVSRGDLVGEYLGQTAPKTINVIKKAFHGILFIDEAYTLSRQMGLDPYGQEAIDTLLKEMENNRSQLVVIVAGYTNEMKTFIECNPGLKSRFNRFFVFNPYSPDELVRIFEHFVHQSQYKLENKALQVLRGSLDNNREFMDEDFGNARWIRNLFERTLQFMSKRLGGEPELSTYDLNLILAKDVEEALERINKDCII